jgi:hypothetical protein
MRKVHRHEHHFPEDVEQQEVERDEYADHAGLLKQQHGVVLLDAILDGVPTGEHRDESGQGGEHHQQHADAVDAEVVVDAERGDPFVLLDELKPAVGLVPIERQGNGDEEARQCGEIGPELDGGFVGGGQEQQDQHAGQRREQDDAEQGIVHRIK